jgi:hypothetical protein
MARAWGLDDIQQSHIDWATQMCTRVKHTMGEPLFTIFHPKNWCIISIMVCSKLKSWWHFLETLNIRKTILECAWENFGTRSSFWIKVKFDPMVRWKDLDQINVHKIYNIHLFNNHRTSCLWFMTHYQTQKNEKKIQCPPIKSYPFF